MRLSTFIGLSQAIIIACFAAVTAPMLLNNALDRTRASDGVVAAYLTELTLKAVSRISLERGPTNGALGTQAPLPPERLRPLEAARMATDAALDAVSQEIAVTRTPRKADILNAVEAARRKLRLVRPEIDRLLTQKLADRARNDLDYVAVGMIGVIPLLSPALNATEAILARADPRLISPITAARLATEMRDHGGQLGSLLAAAVASRQLITMEENTHIERINGYLDALNEQFRLAYAKMDRDPMIDAALANVDRHFFGAARGLVGQMVEAGRTTGNFPMTTAEFSAVFVPELNSMTTLRDTAVAGLIQRIDAMLAETNRSLAINGSAVTLALIVIGALPWVLRARVAVRLFALTAMIDQIARRDYNVTAPAGKSMGKTGEMTGAIETLRRVAIAVEANEERIARLTEYDALTGLANRTRLHERMEQAVNLASRGQNSAAICLDLDRFKAVNDAFGHAVGDKLLQAVAERLLSCARETDTVSRIGGGEFVVLLAGLQDVEQAGNVAQRIVRMLGEPFAIDGCSIVASCSAGVAVTPQDAASAVDLLKNAGVALGRAKQDEPGSYRFFEAEMDARLKAKVVLEADLRAAVQAEAFELFYQPQFNLATDQLCGFEALLRWRHPRRGLVSPIEFIPLAEETGLIAPIGVWVLRQAMMEATHWPDAVKVAVNLSAVQFKTQGLVQTVEQALAESGLPSHRLELEITESVLMNNNAATLATLRALRELGLSISMDDFGTGYSSLSYLRSFPFDKIKIDRSFVRDLSLHADAHAIIRAVVSVADALGMLTTAEGVETRDQLDQLRQTGCTEVQGYLFSKPIPAEAARSMAWREVSITTAA